jgi:hypothetical protein
VRIGASVPTASDNDAAGTEDVIGIEEATPSTGIRTT